MAALAINDTADGRRVLALTGRLDATTLPDLWDAARLAAAEAPRRPLIIDAAGVDYCDGAGAALFSRWWPADGLRPLWCLLPGSGHAAARCAVA